MTGAQNRKLRLEGEKAHAEGDLAKAASRYLELERLEPHDPNWPRRIAEICKEMGKKGRDEQIRALARAADKYANTGDVLKAIAMCKALLDIDPNHYQTQHRLAALYVERAHGTSARRNQGEVGGWQEPISVPSLTSPQAASHITQPPQGQVVAAPMHSMPNAPAMPATVTGPTQIPPSMPMQPMPTAPAAALESLELHRAVPRTNITPQESFPRTPNAAIHEIPLGGEAQITAPPRTDSRKRAIMRAQTVLPFSPLFSSLSEQSLVQLIQSVRLIHLPAGTVLFRQGDGGEAMFVVAEGEVAIIAEQNPRIELARLGEGAFFGEIALLTNQPRNATAESIAETQLLEIDRATVNRLIQTEAGVLPALLRFVSRRVLDRVFQTHPLFRETPARDRAQLATRFRFLEVEAGSTLVHEGAVPVALFVLIAGSVCTTSTHNPIAQRVTGAGTLFGQDPGPAHATIWAETKCLVLGLRRDTPANLG